MRPMSQSNAEPGDKPARTHHSRGILLGGQALHPERARAAFLAALLDRGFTTAEPGAPGSLVVSLPASGREGFFAHFADPDRHAHALGLALARALHSPVTLLELRGSAPDRASFEMKFTVVAFSFGADGSASMAAPPPVPASLLRHPCDQSFTTVPDEATFQECLSDAEASVADQLLASLLPERDLQVLGLSPPTKTTPLRLLELGDAKVAASDWVIEDGPGDLKTLRLKAADGSRRVSVLTAEEAEVVRSLHAAK